MAACSLGRQHWPVGSLVHAASVVTTKSGLYYKSFTIVNYASVWSITYNRNLRSLAMANPSCDGSFIKLATVIMIINYDRKTFIVQGPVL
jgi:hypothetical protein